MNDNDMCDIVQSVTSQLLRQDAVVLQEAPIQSDSDRLFGRVDVSGAFNGSVMLSCSRELARRAVDRLALSDDNGSMERDLIAELTNVIGGNLKALLSSDAGATCRLSLPVVAEFSLAPAQARVLNDMWCACDGEPLHVSILEGRLQ